jgi:hypothetical protein
MGQGIPENVYILLNPIAYGDNMNHKEKAKGMEAYHKAMQQRIERHNAGILPPSVKVDKLEAAYDKLQNYVYKLVPKDSV